ncbi:ClpP family protease [Nocardioides bruguierae]|uniref:ClpP family protease n=1 Tax=Nocardioides bruguierae TaxID=2945102 RepID=UPI002020D117|nr:ATP-dependent Clp protease proteolytic subunit [Nocardioides bruguierae]MCL8027205.1 ATP-dependent Clp protease proteolytic subunit [Nocardioides bruguierae]
MTDAPPVATAPALASRTAEELLAHRVLLLDAPLDDGNGAQLMAQLALLSAQDPESDIALWVHSPGGSVSAMLAIADLIDLVPNDVVTLGLGMSYSAGQFLLCCGTPGKRYVLPHGKVLLHQGSAGIGGMAPDIELQADDLRRMRETVLGVIAERTGQTRERVFEDSLRDRTFEAAEAVEYGFADAVLTDLSAALPTPRRSGLGLLGAAPAGGAR